MEYFSPSNDLRNVFVPSLVMLLGSQLRSKKISLENYINGKDTLSAVGDGRFQICEPDPGKRLKELSCV